MYPCIYGFEIYQSVQKHIEQIGRYSVKIKTVIAFFKLLSSCVLEIYFIEIDRMGFGREFLIPDSFNQRIYEEVCFA